MRIRPLPYALASLATAFVAASGFGQTVANLGPGGYTQSFDTLPNGAPVPVGNPANLGAALNPALNGIFAVQTGPSANPNIVPTDALIPIPGDVLAGGLLSFGSPASSTERALGFFASPGNGTVAAGIRLRNAGPTPLASITLGFVLEQYLEAGNPTLTPRGLNFSYRLIDPALSDMGFSGTLGGDAGWLTAGFATTIRDGNGAQLSFATGAAGGFVLAPKATNGTPVRLDGNAAGNRRIVESLVALDSPLLVGGDVAIRFSDADDPGSDPGIGVDSVAVGRGAAVPEPGTVVAMAAGLLAFMARRRRSRS